MELSGKFVFFENNEVLRKSGTNRPSFINLEVMVTNPVTHAPTPAISKVACWLSTVTYKEGETVKLEVKESEFKGEKVYTLIPPRKQFSPINSKATIRLGCLNAAITCMKPNEELGFNDMIQLAEKFEKWVTE